MVWDAGLAIGSEPGAPKTSVVQLLKQLGVAPEQVRYVGISHYHYDHIGQAVRSRAPRSSSASETGT